MQILPPAPLALSDIARGMNDKMSIPVFSESLVPKGRTVLKLSRAAQTADRELADALLVGIDCDPKPITAVDFAELLRADGVEVTNREVFAALDLLYCEGKIDRDVMFCQKRNCTVNHYFGHEWDGSK